MSLKELPRPTVSLGRRRGWLVRRALAAADIAGLVTSFLVAQWLRTGGSVADGISPSAETVLFIATPRPGSSSQTARALRP